MGIDSNNIPEAMRRCLAPEVRKEIGPQAMTMDDAERKRCHREEKKMHDVFEQWLNLNTIPYIHARMDKPSTILKGFPDFTMLWNGRGACVEFKAPGGRVSDDQSQCITKLNLANVPVQVFEDVQSAIYFAKEVLGL